MKVLLALPAKSHLSEITCGGLERTALKMSSALSEIGVECNLVCYSQDDTVTNAITFCSSLEPGKANLEEQKNYLPFVIDVARNYDVVLAFSFKELLCHEITPVVCWYLNDEDRWLPESNKMQIGMNVAFPAVWMRRAFEKENPEFPRGRMHVVPLGVDMDTFTPASGFSCHGARRSLRIGMACVWHEGKGVSTYLNACRRLERMAVPFEASLYGSTDMWGCAPESLKIYPMDERRRMERKIRETARNVKGINLKGAFEHSKMSLAYRKMDLFCLPSIWREAFPLALLEAMACGLPAVCSDIGGHREIIKEGINGFLVPVGDADALALIWRELAENPDLLRFLKTNARSSIKCYSWETIVRRITLILEKIVFSCEKM